MSRAPIASLILCLGTTLPAFAHAQDPQQAFVDPLALYGPRVAYDILRNGEKVGDHQITFSRQGEALIAETSASIEIPFLFLTGYRFDYQSTSVWEDNLLTRLTARTDDDGELSEVSVTRDDQDMSVTGPTGTLELERPLLPTEHWSQSFVQDQQVLNTITGHVNNITTTTIGSAFVPAANGIIRANRYRLDGDIRLETWYDPAGRWLGMRFAGEDGSTIEYRCRTCPAQLAKAQ
ncbi:MAG: hypothetical protein IPK59_04295 [Rhodospirillaceae bacterium]|nr:hypothetical protein [Rhodospirillaceae bacterium]